MFKKMNKKELRLVFDRLAESHNTNDDDSDCEAIAGTLNVSKEQVATVLDEIRKEKTYKSKKRKRMFKITAASASLFFGCLGLFLNKLWLPILAPSLFFGSLLVFFHVFAIATGVVVFMSNIDPIERETK